MRDCRAKDVALNDTDVKTRTTKAARPLQTKPPKVGETCPACGQIVHEKHEAVVFTAAELAEERKRLEDLINRRLAAREADPLPGDGH